MTSLAFHAARRHPLILLLTVLVGTGLSLSAWAADWKVVMKSRDRRVELDTASVIDSDGGTKVAWARVVLPRAALGSSGYATVKALNRYDCNNRTFETIKRVYLDADNLVLKEERVTDLLPLQVTPRSVDEALWREVCKPPLAADLRKLASAAGRAAGKEAAPGPAPAQAADASGHAEPVADHKSGGTAAGAIVHADAQPAAKAGPTAPTKTPAAAQPATARATPPSGPQLSETLAPDEATAHSLAEARLAIERRSAQMAPSPAPAAPVVQVAAAGKSRPGRSDAAAVRTPVAQPVPATQLPDWRYEEPGGPASWGTMRPEWKLCGSGQRQSPIDLSDAYLVDLQPVVFDYRPSLFRELDDGHTLSLTLGPGNAVQIRGKRYELQRIEFHRPAENRIAGKSYEMGVQFIHRSVDGERAVVAVLLERGSGPNAALQTVWNNLPLERNAGYTPATPLDLKVLLPSLPEHYLFMGSLTRPPCSEGVLWAVMKQPVQISDGQMNLFARMYPMNARPVQSGFGRTILENR